jgi:hypothetical protein
MADDPAPGRDPLLAALRAARPGLAGPDRTATSPEAEAMLRRILAQPGSLPEQPRRPLRGRGTSYGPWLQRKRRPRRLPRRAVIVVAIAATLAGAGLFSSLIVTGGAARRTTRLPETTQTASYVTGRVEGAAARISHDVIHTQITAGSYTRDTWFGPGDAVRLRTYRRGRLLSDVIETPRRITVIDYADHTWWTTSNPPASPAECTLPACVAIKLSPGRLGSFLLSVAFGHALTGTGSYQVDGITQTAGHRALLLTGRFGAGSTVRIWVDPGSYLPLRSVVSGGQPARSVRSSIAYLPPTAANMATLKAPVPAGFARRWASA